MSVVEEQAIVVRQVVAASPTAVYYALTNAAALREWLCDNSQTDVRENGRFYLHWNQGYYASGEFVDLVPNQSFALRWQGKNEPAVSRVDVVLTSQGDSTEIELTHSGLGSGAAWAQTVRELRDGWEGGLANLKSTLETGLDKRIFDRPFLGILINRLVSQEEGAAMGIPIEGGVEISGTAPDTGAAAVGLQPNDIITNLAGVNLTNFQAIGEALAPYRAGEKVKIIYYRGDEQLTDLLELAQRPAPQIPETAVSFAEALRQIYDTLDSELDALLAGVAEAEASFSPGEGVWNIKEHLAHLIGTERVVQIGIAMQISDGALGGFPNNPQAGIEAITAVYSTLAAITTAWKNSESETVALIAGLPDAVVARKATYLGMANTLLTALPGHNRNHFNEMRGLITAAREAAA